MCRHPGTSESPSAVSPVAATALLPGAATVVLPVPIPAGERCRVCVERLREVVDALPGVGSVAIDPAASLLTLEFDAGRITCEAVVAEVERLGHEVSTSIRHAFWRITGLDCPDCARTVDKSVAYLDGVLSAHLNFASGVLAVEYDADSDPRDAVSDLVGRMGYGVEPPRDATNRPVAEFVLFGGECLECADELTRRAREWSGVERAEIDVSTARIRIGYDSATTTPDALADAVTRAGYPVELVKRRIGEADGSSWWRQHRADIVSVVGGLFIAAAWIAARAGGPELLSVALYASAILTGGSLVFRRAISSVRARSLDMNVLMTIAVIGAALIGEWGEGAAVVFLFAVGGMLESRSLARTRRSIRDLMDLAPETARVVRDGETFELTPSEIVVGDTLVIRAGERLPLDGVVIEGSSAVDESPITGESVPLDKTAGDQVYAGSLNTNGVLTLCVTALAGDSTLARVIHLVEEAQAQQAPFQRLVDRFIRYYTPAVVVFAALVAVVPPVLGTALGAPWGDFGTWFYRALVLLVVSCPCALVISTPVAIVSAITRATRDGVLIKGGAFLEIAPKIRAVAFDKTGTLTHGRPEVADVFALDGGDAGRLLELTAALESHSNHPLARAVVRAAGDDGARVLVTGIREIAGRGLTGRIDGVEHAVGSPVFAEECGVRSPDLDDTVARFESDGRTALVVMRLTAAAADDGGPPAAAVALGVIGVADQVRAVAEAAIRALRVADVEHLVMLTGDNERTAEAVARQAGLTEYRARLLPQDKTAVIAELKERYGAVAMIGDGVNDAPALARADIGIAMGAAGSDTALETADVALMSDDLMAVPRFLDLGRRTVANIRQNVWASVAVKFAVLVAAVAGYAPLWLAVFADTGVALLVILNGLRLLRATR